MRRIGAGSGHQPLRGPVSDTTPPSGTVTLLFTDIEGSTKLWDAHADAMRVALPRHDALVRELIESSGGHVFKTVGDAFCAAFAAATDALRAAVVVQRALASEVWPEGAAIRVRMAMHTGECAERDGDYFGSTVNRVARLEALAHGGQIVVSGATAGVLGDALPEGVGLRDLGQHRLKDLTTPERVFQVDVEGLAQEFAALRSLDNPELGNNLPRFLSSLVGREAELKEVRRLVDANRLVTLTGAGGAGKTRLALQVAADLLDGSGDGVWFVELGAVGDSDRVDATVAGVLAVREDATRPMVDVLVDALADRAVLVVLDNCEHVIDAVAKLADRLMRSCPTVEMITTSREPLGIDGEVVYRVPSLPVPVATASLDEIAATDAVRLFIERGRLHQPAFEIDADNAGALAAIARRLDGIPLALELAAARLRSMNVGEIADRLDQRFRLLTTGGRVAVARQQTLRGAIDWSFDLLDNAERAVLCRASVFVSGFDLSAAESVLGDGETVDVFEVVDLVDRLVDKSLIQHDPAASGRYRLLESIREYGAEQHASKAVSTAADVRRAHLAHYLALARSAEPQLAGPDQITWNRRLDVDRDNILAALHTSIELPDTSTLGLHLAVALSRYWTRNGHGAQVVEPFRVLCERETDDRDRAAGFAALALTCCAIGQVRAGYDAADTAVTLARRLADPHLLAHALRNRSAAADLLSDHRNALTDANEAYALADTTDDAALKAEARHTRAFALYGVGDHTAARAEWIATAELHREIGDLYGEARELVNLADDELETDDLEHATLHLTDAEPLIARLDSSSLSALLHENLGLLAVRNGQPDDARSHFGAALTISRRTHDNQVFASSLIGYASTVVGFDPMLAATFQAGANALLQRLDLSVGENETRMRRATSRQIERRLTPVERVAADDRGRRLSIPELVALTAQRTGGQSPGQQLEPRAGDPPQA